MSNGEKASAIFNEYNNTNKGEAFVTTGCTNSTLDAVVNYIDLEMFLLLIQFLEHGSRFIIKKLSLRMTVHQRVM